MCPPHRRETVLEPAAVAPDRVDRRRRRRPRALVGGTVRAGRRSRAGADVGACRPAIRRADRGGRDEPDVDVDRVDHAPDLPPGGRQPTTVGGDGRGGRRSSCARTAAVVESGGAVLAGERRVMPDDQPRRGEPRDQRRGRDRPPLDRRHAPPRSAGTAMSGRTAAIAPDRRRRRACGRGRTRTRDSTRDQRDHGCSSRAR